MLDNFRIDKSIIESKFQEEENGKTYQVLKPGVDAKSMHLNPVTLNQETADCQGVGTTSVLALCAFVALCGASLRKPVQSQMCVLGNMSIGGTISKVPELANTLQVCFDAGAKKNLLPMSSAADIAMVPYDLFAKFQTSFYTSPEDAVFKALGIE